MLAISLPFRIDGYGRIAMTSTTGRVWADRVRTVLATTLNERVLRPEFGSDVTQTLYDSLDEAPGIAFETVSYAFAQFLPTLTLQDVSITETDVPEGEISLSVTYSLPDKTTDTTTVGLAYGSSTTVYTEATQ